MGAMSFPSNPPDGYTYEKWYYDAASGEWKLSPIPSTTLWSEGEDNKIYYDLGEVGVGTSEPTRDLVIFNSAGPVLQITDQGSGDVNSDGLQLKQLSANSEIMNKEAGNLVLGTDDTARMTIDHLGTATFSGTVNATTFAGNLNNSLTINGTTYNNSAAVNITTPNTTYSTATSSALGLVKIGYAANGKNYPVALNNGQMYVNVPWSDTNTTYTAGNGLTLTGTQFTMSGSYTGTLTCTGDVVAYSDVAVKEDIDPIVDALKKVSQIGGYTFKRKDDDSRKYTGVIAQEVQKVLPEAVHGEEEGGLAVAYGNLVGLLIEAVKEQQEQIEIQQVQINELKDKLEK